MDTENANNNSIPLEESERAKSIQRVTSRRSFTVYVRDTGIESCEPQKAEEIREAEEFLQSLPDICYNVMKIFPWGSKKERVLKLSKSGIENCRGNVESYKVSSVHTYKSVISVGLKDVDVLVISYENSHDYFYKSPIAMQIVQEITCRLAIRRTTEKKKLSYDIALKYQQKVLRESETEDGAQEDYSDFSGTSPISRSVSLASSLNSVGSLTNSSSSIGNHMHSSNNNNNDDSDTDGNSSNNNSNNNSLSDLSALSPVLVEQLKDVTIAPKEKRYRSFVAPSVARSESRKTSTKKRATKLLTLLGSTEQQRLEVEVDRVVLDTNQVEGRTIHQYHTHFHVLAKNPTTAAVSVRQFMSAIKDHLLHNRTKALSKLLVEAQTESYIPDELSLYSVVERSLQKAVVAPLNDAIAACISKQTAQANAQLKTKIEQLRGKPQSFFGIEAELTSPSNWYRAILELNYMNRCQLPCDKIQTLLSTARSIYNSINYQKRKALAPISFLSADEFLPIFIYCVVHSELEDMETISEYLWALCDPSQLSGEYGYYLTVFTSSLQFIRGMDTEKGVGEEKLKF